tara:strand:+ start:402 stop:1022 length:621 start_codon:yes stop_codon:yes gene_type:complete
MSNYIQIQVGVEDVYDLPLKSGSVTPLDISTVTWVADGSATDLTISGATQGTGAAGTVTIGGGATGPLTVALSIGATSGDGGNDYKVGDTVSVISTSGAQFTGSITFVVTEAMLIAPPADSVALIDADQVVAVKCPSDSDLTVELFTNEYNGSAVSKYTCSFELDNITIQEIAVNISEAFRKAEQAENSQPFVELADAECLGVTFA